MTQPNEGAPSNENTGAPSNQTPTPSTAGNSVNLDDATINRIAEASTRQAASQHRSEQNDAGSNNAGHQNSGAQGNGSNDILTAIQALPETVARAVQEAITPPKQPEGTGAQSNENKSAEGNQGEPGKWKSFGHWWMGIK